MTMQGTLGKMISQLGDTVQYHLPVGEQTLALNPLIGQSLQLNYSGKIFCAACGRKTNKSYAQGYCFVCMQNLARCDMCIMKPHTCHFHQGTCREPQWGENNCMTTHFVYLANTSGLKVGITRQNNIPTRWIDQGASQALPIVKVKTRQISGLVEVAMAELVADKTNWRAMLKGVNEPLDLSAQAQSLLPQIEQSLMQIIDQHGADAIELVNAETVSINYPVTEYPSKIVSHNLDKTPTIEGVLQGIKGQYLLFDNGVFNVRKFTSYEITLTH